MQISMFLLVALALAPTAQAGDAEDVREFFDEFAERADEFDVRLAELYSDDARIVTLRDGTDTQEMNGSQFKGMIRYVMPIAKKRGDTNTFSDIKVSSLGEGFRVTAIRVPAAKCAPDENYHLDVAKSDGQWRVLEEYTETVSLSRCEPSKKLAASLEKLRRGILPRLPADLDRDTRLESVEVAGSALIYTQRLHSMTAGELDRPAVGEVLYHLGMQGACAAPEIKALIAQGATVRYATVDRDGVRLGNVDVAPGMCP